MATLRSILLATDFRQSSQDAAEVAARLATTFSAHVTVLHVREEYLTWPVSPFENQDQLAERLAASNVQVDDFIVRAGSPAEVVVRKAQELDPDLLIIGAGEKVRDGHLVIGPVAEAILERVDLPVLAVNPQGPKLRFESILCPVDHSRVSRRALDDALHLARTFGGKLVVLSVVPDVSWLAAAAETGQLAGAKLEHETRWVREFDEFLAGVSLQGVSWERELRHGAPHEQIAAVARERGTDLLIMGATGRTGIVRALLGSVTRRVLRQPPCSLMLVKDHNVFEEQYLLDLEAIDRLVTEGHERLTAGVPAEAAGRFRQALAINPFHAVALNGLVQACERLGQTEAAQRYRNRLEQLKQQTGG